MPEVFTLKGTGGKRRCGGASEYVNTMSIKQAQHMVTRA